MAVFEAAKFHTIETTDALVYGDLDSENLKLVAIPESDEETLEIIQFLVGSSTESFFDLVDSFYGEPTRAVAARQALRSLGFQ